MLSKKGGKMLREAFSSLFATVAAVAVLFLMCKRIRTQARSILAYQTCTSHIAFLRCLLHFRLLIMIWMTTTTHSLDLTLSFPFEEVLLALVLCEELELTSVDGAPPLQSDHLHCVLIFHAQLDQSHGHEDRSSPEAGHTVDTHARLCRVSLLEGFLDEEEPLFQDFAGGCTAVRKGQLCDGHSRLLQVVGLVGRVSGAHQVADLVRLENTYIVVNGGVLRLLRDEEPHVLELDLGRRRPNEGMPSHPC